jgi:hypothetical protein
LVIAPSRLCHCQPMPRRRSYVCRHFFQKRWKILRCVHSWK